MAVVNTLRVPLFNTSPLTLKTTTTTTTKTATKKLVPLNYCMVGLSCITSTLLPHVGEKLHGYSVGQCHISLSMMMPLKGQNVFGVCEVKPQNHRQVSNL